MKKIFMRAFDFINNPIKLLKPEIVQMVGSIYNIRVRRSKGCRSIGYEIIEKM